MEPIVEIREACAYIKKMYGRICQKTPMLKYHKGIVKYIFLKYWCTDMSNINRSSDYDEIKILCKIVKKASEKFPNAHYAITEDIKELIPVHTRSTPELCWMSGYFQGASTEYPEPATSVILLDKLELDESDFENSDFLKAKLELLIEEAQDILDSLDELEEEDEE